MKKVYLLLFAIMGLTTGFTQLTFTNVYTQTFNAIAQRGNAVNISWTALNESDMVRHEIEKSANGSAFTVIGSVTAQNNATPYLYNYLDATPSNGQNYYRLRSISKSGNASYSSILRINMGRGRTDMTVISNPVSGKVLNLQLNNLQKGKYAINIFSNVGQKIYTQSMELSSGSSTEIINLPSTLARGTYFVQLTDGSINLNKQIVVQ